MLQMMFTVIKKLYMNLKNMTRSAVRVLAVFWLHTSKPANTRGRGVLSSVFLCCLASVERGFSINSEIMEYNFTQKSIVALRNIYDHIQTCGGILHVKIEQELKNAVKNVSSEFCCQQKRQQEEKKNEEKH